MERSLVERARAGDRDAFEAIVRDKVDAVYRTAYAILGNAADAQDATQEAFISAWRGLAQLRETDRFEAWLSRIVANACRMAARRRRSGVREVALDVQAADVLVGRQSVDGETAGAIAFDRAFERLSVDARWLVVAHHLDGRQLSELATELDVPLGTVKSRLHTARVALQRALDDER